MFLLFLCGILLFVLFLFGISMIHLVPLVVLAWITYKIWWLGLSLIVAAVVYYTIKYRREDMFAHVCQEYYWISDVANNLEDPEYLSWMHREYGSSWQETGSMGVLIGSYYFALWPLKHACESNPRIIYSKNGTYRALIYHTHWRNYGLYQKNDFLIRYERV